MIKKFLNILLRRKPSVKGSARRRHPAESLIEVIIAVFVVATGSAAATSLIVSSMQANAFSKDNLIALNLAVEGMEAMRIIRDTNWIKYGFDKTNCWNLDPLEGVGDCKTPYNRIGEGPYSPDLNLLTSSWSLRAPSLPLDLNNLSATTNEEYRLGYTDLDSTVDSDDDGFPANDKDVYVPLEFINSNSLPDNGESKFYRMVEVSYDTGDPADAEVMNVVSTVQWRQQGVHQVQLSTSLSNYQKVPNS